jgi:hypothetical protein
MAVQEHECLFRLTTHQRLGNCGTKNTRGNYLCMHYLESTYGSCDIPNTHFT